MLPLLLVVCGALATARLTRLVTADQLTLPLRRRLLVRVREGGQLEYLLSCTWCASVWIALPVAFAVVLSQATLRPDGVVLIPLLTLAYSQLAGLTASREVEV